MNATGRKKLNELISMLEQVKSDITSLGEEEQEKFDNMPEGLQQGERGTRMEEVASLLSEQESTLDDVISALEEAAND